MATFVDGPAKGKHLLLRRAPKLLRIVQNPKGEWDGLDQIGDTPEESEKIFIYRRIGAVSQCHLCCRGKGKGASGWYEMANYAHVDEQVEDHVLRLTTAWQLWCQENGPRLLKEDGKDARSTEANSNG